MAELVSGSQYSSGWRPVSRSDESEKKYDAELDKKIKSLLIEFDNLKAEFDEKIKTTIEQSNNIQLSLNKKIDELASVIAKKDEEIFKLKEENAALKDKYNALYVQLFSKSNRQNENTLTAFIKKITDKKSHQNSQMHSID